MVLQTLWINIFNYKFIGTKVIYGLLINFSKSQNLCSVEICPKILEDSYDA